MRQNIKNLLKGILLLFFVPVLYVAAQAGIEGSLAIIFSFLLNDGTDTYTSYGNHYVLEFIWTFLVATLTMLVVFYSVIQILPKSRTLFQIFIYGYIVISFFAVGSTFGISLVSERLQSREVLINLMVIFGNIVWIFLVRKFWWNVEKNEAVKYKNKLLKLWNNKLVHFIRLTYFPIIVVWIIASFYSVIGWSIAHILAYSLTVKWYVLILLSILTTWLAQVLIGFWIALLTLLIIYICKILPNRNIGFSIYAFLHLLFWLVIFYRFWFFGLEWSSWYHILFIMMPLSWYLIFLIVGPLQAMLVHMNTTNSID